MALASARSTFQRAQSGRSVKRQLLADPKAPRTSFTLKYNDYFKSKTSVNYETSVDHRRDYAETFSKSCFVIKIRLLTRIWYQALSDYGFKCVILKLTGSENKLKRISDLKGTATFFGQVN